ncbi:MAG: hypothetical protein WBJ06_06960 [Candidatus Methanoculleus thermohydrogenotrophicum]|jgi:hypothetical protein|nr:hypothetical protein [Candidatus Methanoculleus thermohydrogenotrophicum]
MGIEGMWCKCEGCGRDLTDIDKESSISENREPCPDCGSVKRNYFITLEERVRVSNPKFSMKGKDSSGFLRQKITIRESHSDKTDRPVIITKEVDRTNPEYTLFHHKIEEYDEHGIFLKTIHEHTNRNEAKRRPRTDSESS